jgi:hypothetical protein
MSMPPMASAFVLLGQVIEPNALIILGPFPLRADPFLPFEAMQGGIEGTRIYL